MRSAISAAVEIGPGVTQDFERAKREVLSQLERDPEMHAALADQLRRDFDKNVQQSHDFLQLAKLVQGHAETLLREKNPGLNLAEAAQFAPTEGSIYYATQLMVRKLDSLAFLQDPLRAKSRTSSFDFHGLFRTYTLIYQWQANQKDLTLRVEGDCRARCTYNTQAVGAVLQGILDNLVKYAPAGSNALMRLDEKPDRVSVTFTSLGPRIDDDERGKIFLPGYRAAAARSGLSDGQGLGLATAHQVSEALGLSLKVSQQASEDPRFSGYFSTTFSFEVEKD